MSTKPNSRVYFARCISWAGADLGAIKVGLASEPEKRVKSVCSQQPYECELLASVPGDIFVECFVHMWLRDLSLGGEFFKNEGEAARIVDYASKFRRLPFAISFESEWKDGTRFSDIDAKAFMAERGMTLADVEDLAGVSRSYYQKLFEQNRINRRFLAALAVAAIKRGESIHWPLDFIPPKPPLVGRYGPSPQRTAA